MIEKIIGIDLGTTNSCVSVFENGKPVVIPNSEGKRTTPSIVAFLENGDRKIGDSAKRQAVTNKNTIYSIKRFIGSKYDDVADISKKMPYTIEKDSQGKPVVVVGDKRYSPEEISAIIIQKMKKTAEDYLGTEVKKAIITVPSYFNDNQRQATKVAGEIAGLEILRVINEPTSACLAYGLNIEKDQTVVVYDVGGGTTDFSVLEIFDGVFEVISTSGDASLGGDNFDEIIIDWIADKFMEVHNGIDLRKEEMSLQRLKEAAEKAKIELSTSISTDINLPYIIPVDNIPQHFNETLTRAKFEQISSDLLDRIKKPCLEALRASDKDISEIDEIILVGGSCRIPAIQEMAKTIFGKEANKSANLDEIVAQGAAIQGSILAGETNDILLLDVTSISYSIETIGAVATKMIDGNTTIPVTKEETFSTAVDNQPEVSIRVCQGERPMFADNKLIGEFNLSDIPPAMRGVPQISVKFDIDVNGILKITAKDNGSGKEQEIIIKDSMSIDDTELERMKKEALENEESDKKKLEDVQIINDADSIVFQTEKMLKDSPDKISEDNKKDLEDKITLLKEVIEIKNIEEIKVRKDTLMEKMQEIGQDMYSSEQGCGCSDDSCEGQGSCGDDCSCKDDNIEDVTFEEID